MRTVHLSCSSSIFAPADTAEPEVTGANYPAGRQI